MSSSFVLPVRPAALTIAKTCVFKTVNDVPIHVDIYQPPCSSNTSSQELAPVMLFIHGGGWTGSNRLDYSRPLFQHFLDRGFVIASMDYRLVPESSNLHQLEDVKDIEGWLRNELSGELGETQLLNEEGKVEDRKIVVVGASAGGQLGLLVPKLWTVSPTAMLILYPPTNMHKLPYSGRGRLAALTLPPPSQALLTEATCFDSPPSQRAIPKCALDYLGPRVVMSTHMFRDGLVAELLLKGLRNGLWSDEEEDEEREERDSGYDGDYDGGEEQVGEEGVTRSDVEVKRERQLRLPEKGCATVEEIDGISPLQYLLSIPASPARTPYPPTYLLTGTSDEMFIPADHSTPFYEELLAQNVSAKLDLQPGLGHAFDIWAEMGGPIAEDVLKPAVQWCETWVR